MAAGEPPATPWARGRLDARHAPPELLFGAMYEDWAIEAELFRPGSRVFAIASAGCTSLALAARGMTVTAVDINPVQVEYVAARLAGAPPAAGATERNLARLGRALRGIGPGEADLRAFLAMDDPAEQRRFFRQRFARPPLRGLLRVVMHPRVLTLAYASPFLRALPPRFDRVLLDRLDRGFATHPNRTNPYAWRLLLGSDPPDAGPMVHPPAGVTVLVDDAAAFLERAAPGSFDAFTLSNILDATSADYGRRLWAAVAHAAAPGATAILRSFAQPRTDAARELAARDRALLWGSIEAMRFGPVKSAPASGCPPRRP
jgi:S-adenosylmethionine:diacylglycerol 3-amino-3-carboxypropyl transferase